ncbi:hypothetical protein [Kaarinaea lacus]
MEIYIGNLPGEISPGELKKVVNAVLLPNNFREFIKRLFQETERITHSEFDVIQKVQGDSHSCFAHGVIKPDRIARRLLYRMDHLTFQGKSLRVREFTQRDAANDRRCKSRQNLFSVEVYNRRQQERRHTSIKH